MSATLPILEYHGVHPAPRGLHHHFLYIQPRRFRNQLALLRRLGVRGLSMSMALQHWREGRAGRVVALTFDDAYADVFDHALPLLRATGFTATAYAVTAHIGDFNAWDAEVVGVQKPTMTRDQLRAWHNAGMEVGAHTRTHARLTECSDAQLADEVSGCRTDLTDLLGDAVTQFCYPYGAADARAIQAVRAAGFEAAVCTRRGRAHASDDPFLLPRIAVRGDVPLPLYPFRILTRYADRHRP